jgi:hypothetical protein
LKEKAWKITSLLKRFGLPGLAEFMVSLTKVGAESSTPLRAPIIQNFYRSSQDFF